MLFFFCEFDLNQDILTHALTEAVGLFLNEKADLPKDILTHALKEAVGPFFFLTSFFSTCPLLVPRSARPTMEEKEEKDSSSDLIGRKVCNSQKLDMLVPEV